MNRNGFYLVLFSLFASENTCEAKTKKHEEVTISKTKEKKKYKLKKTNTPATRTTSVTVTKNKGAGSSQACSQAKGRAAATAISRIRSTAPASSSTAPYTEKTIEINSVNFIRFKNKAHEIFIPDPNVIDVQLLSDNSLYLIGIEPGCTSLVVNDIDGNVIANYKILVTYPIKAIKAAIKELHQDAHVEIVSIDSSVVLKGQAPSPEAAADIQDIVARFIDEDKIINRLSIETSTQVMLKVKIAEVSRKLSKELGINWRAFTLPQDPNGGLLGAMFGRTANFITPITGEYSSEKLEGLKDALIGNDGKLNTNVNGGRWIFHSGGKKGLSGLIDALSDESFAAVLAEPTLVAMSGKTAIFKSGGERGFTVRQDGTDSNTTEFKEWGTSIEFTPIVLSEDRINITVSPKVSTLDFEGGKNAAPSLITKEASTTIELGSGESMAIAGLLQKTKSSIAIETPLLAGLPILGPLFRHSTMVGEEREIVIIITPYIVRPSSKQLRTPIDMMPRMFSPLSSIIRRKFHNVRKPNSRISAAGLCIR